LSNRGALFTQVVKGTSRDGFDAEWREIALVSVEGEKLNRCELFDEADIDKAIARFEQLNSPVPQPDNAATRIWKPLKDAFNHRDMDRFLALITSDGRVDDRRNGLRALHEGTERMKAVHALFEAPPKSWQMEIHPVAIRGAGLSLIRQTYYDTEEVGRPITVETFTLTELAEDGRLRDIVLFDPDDLHHALDELTARWIASGEVAHPEVIEAYMQILQKLNRHDWDAYFAGLADATYVNHRQLGAGETIADFTTSVTVIASLVPNVCVEPAEILTYTASGAVGNLLAKGVTSDGVEVEIPMVMLGLFDGDRLTHFELFDAHERDLALARFAELNASR
jgi:hypothetical protein